jgi:hypothetical protein
MARAQYGPIGSNLCFQKNYDSTRHCYRCAVALLFNARVLYNRKLRRAACESCGEQIKAELIGQRLEREQALAPVVRARRENYERQQATSSPYIRRHTHEQV